MSLEDYGWNVTDLPAALESPQGMIKFNCLLNCVRARCASRKNGLECSLACDQYRGMACTNSHDQFDDDGSCRNERMKTYQIVSVNCETIRQHYNSLLCF